MVAWHLGVTHNNLKVSNILLDNNGNVKISDYMGWDILEYITTGIDKGIDQEHSKDDVRSWKKSMLT